nr:defensin-like protein 1 [Tanacetum cinerariifolium]
MVVGMKETNKLCKRRSRLWSGYCLVSERCDRQCREVERAEEAKGNNGNKGMEIKMFKHITFLTQDEDSVKQEYAQVQKDVMALV